VASWWDYGYQTTAMADRAVIVDNNTWNTTHIATVGRAFASPEAKGARRTKETRLRGRVCGGVSLCGVCKAFCSGTPPTY
jgi:hypothetical protein